MSRFKIEAFVIRSTKMSESSRVLTFFSREMGKVKGVAKGVGRPKSKLGGTVELFNLIEGDFYKKETSELGVLSGAGLLDDFRHISDDPRKFGFASAWCEVLDKTLQLEEPHPEIFELTHDFFKILHAAKTESSGLIFWSVVLKFLALEGYSPTLEECVSCGKPITGEKVLISLHRGGATCQNCIEVDEPIISITTAALKLLRDMMNLTLGQLAGLSVDNRTGRLAAEVILSLASYHMNLPRNLKSFKFLETLIGATKQGM
jgi:DNA repair protein RecO (recombination protein O)